MAKIFNKIKNAYDAYWFLYNHPNFVTAERLPTRLTPKDAKKLRDQGYPITEFITEDGSIFYQEEVHLSRHAFEHNLDIHYVKVDETKHINNNTSKNKFVEVWLEFGKLEWTTDYKDVDHDQPILQNYHDTDLDCGGSTFDEALVTLAKKVRRKYGGYDMKRKLRDYCICPECTARRNKTTI